MSKIYIPKDDIESSVDLESSIASNNLMKHDGTTKPSSDIDWNNKKIINLQNSEESHSVINKGYVDKNYVKLYDFNLKKYTQIPVTDGLALSIVPSIELSEYNPSSKIITAINDAKNNITLQQTGSPYNVQLDKDDYGSYLKFSKDYGFLTCNLNSNYIMGDNSNTTAFLISRNPNIGTENATNFSWADGDGILRFQTHYTYRDGTVYVDYGDLSNGGRITKALTTEQIDSIKNVISLFAFRKLDLNGEIFINTERIVNGDITSVLPENTEGTFKVGVSCTSDIYELHIFNRALTDDEMDIMNQYYNNKYKDWLNVKNKRLISVVDPINNQDAATKQYVDYNFVNLVNSIKLPDSADIIISESSNTSLDNFIDFSILVTFRVNKISSSENLLFSCGVDKIGLTVFIQDDVLTIGGFNEGNDSVSFTYEASQIYNLLVCINISANRLTCYLINSQITNEFNTKISLKQQLFNITSPLFPEGSQISHAIVKGGITVGNTLVYNKDLSDTLIDLNNTRIINLDDPNELTEAANKKYVDDISDKLNTNIANIRRYVDDKAKYHVTIWAEEKGALDLNKAEFSWGNGGTDHSEVGYVCLANGRVLRMGVCSIKADHTAYNTSITFAIVLNGVTTTARVVKPGDEIVGTSILEEPIEFMIGDVLNFKSLGSSTVADQTIVNALLEYDII